MRAAIRLRWQLHVPTGDYHRGISISGGLRYMPEIPTFLSGLHLRRCIQNHSPDEVASAVPDYSHPVWEKVILDDGTPNILGLNDVLVIPSPCLDSCYAVVISRSCHHPVSVGIDPNFGRVCDCHRENRDFDGEVCPAITGCRMEPGRAVRSGR